MPTVLIVDDSPSMRALIRQTLVDAGHNVIEAQDGRDALAKLPTMRVDLVLCDVNMPRLDGLSFVKQARAGACKFTPILMLTTEIDLEKQRVAKNAGATGWLVKPFQPAQLLATIRKVLA